LQQAFGRLDHGLVTKVHFHRLAIAADAAVAHVLLAQRAAHIAGQGFGLLAQRRLHVDLQHKVHAATQVQAQIHGRGVQAAQPQRRAR
jgi:hypothetical protein